MENYFSLIRATFAHARNTFFLVVIGGGLAATLADYGAHRTIAVLFATLFFFIGLALIAGSFSIDLVDYLNQATARLRDEKKSKTDLHPTMRQIMEEDLGIMLAIGILSYACFLFSCLGWVAHDPTIFTRSVSNAEVTLFVVDLSLRGLLLDFCEHFGLHVSKVERAAAHPWFSTYTFIFRTYISVIALGAIIRGASLYMFFHRLRRHKKELSAFVRYLD